MKNYNPRHVCLYITSKCNLACSYCAVAKNWPKREMSIGRVCETLDIIKEVVKPQLLVLFGGEPLLRSDISSIIDEVNKRDFEYTVISNGTIDREFVIRKMKGFTLSIDRPDEVKEGTSEACKSSWKMLKKYKDIVPDLVANITVTHDNIDDLEKIVEQLNALGIWIIFGYVHSTRNKEEVAMFRSYCPKLTLTAEDFQTFKEVFYKAKKRHNVEAYVKEMSRYMGMMNWHCSKNPRNPEYLTIANNGMLIACNDFWGERTTKLSVFDLPEIGMKKWLEVCKEDREECQLTCAYNHEVQLCYGGNIIHKGDI